MMNWYIPLILLVSALVLLGSTVYGYHRGLASELSGLLSLIAAGFVILLIAGIVEEHGSGRVSSLLTGGILLILLAIVYRLIHVLMTSINILAKLPIIHGIDAFLGGVIGFLEGFALLYLMEYFLRTFIL